jgi:hypothetical protein
MRSRLEARYAAAMDYVGWEWEYEPRAFGSEAGQYLPDFKVNARTYLEVKGTATEESTIAAAAKMEIILASEPDANLLLLVDDVAALYRRDGQDSGWIGLSLDPRRCDAALAPSDIREVFALAQYRAGGAP